MCEEPEFELGRFLAALFSAAAWLELAAWRCAFVLEMPFGISNLQLGSLRNSA